MKTKTFKGGIHPPQHKSETENAQIKVIMPRLGEEMVYPLSQHIGAPCESVVNIGDRVLVGTKIADSSAYVCAPIHAAVSGEVKALREVVTPSGITTNAIVILNDAKMEEAPMVGTEDYLSFTKDEYLKKIREAGIVGLGGAGFPTHVKLNPQPDKQIDYIIVNAAECEPYLTTDFRVLLEQSYELKRGLQIILKMFPGAKGLIGIETNKMEGYHRMVAVCQDDASISVVPLRPKYPQGCEKQLITALTGRQVPSGGLPADIGCIVDNVDTVIAIDRCVHRGRPLMRKVVTVAGGAVNSGGNFKVRLGMSYASLIAAAGGFSQPPAKVISGGPMMGVAMSSLGAPIIKTSSAVLCLTEKEALQPKETACIRCGRCVENCPAGLLPYELNGFAIRHDEEGFKKYGGLDCIECGSCSYNCPAKRHLAQSIRASRRAALMVKR